MNIFKSRKTQAIALLFALAFIHGTASAASLSFIEKIESWLSSSSSIQKGNDDVHKAIAQNYR